MTYVVSSYNSYTQELINRMVFASESRASVYAAHIRSRYGYGTIISWESV